jgi:hypothetical protein
LSLLKAPPKQFKNAVIQVRVEEHIKLKLDQYAEFIGGNQAYVVSEALRLLFTKDREFKCWREQHTRNNDYQPNEGRTVAKTT